jgi:fatty acid desaturase
MGIQISDYERWLKKEVKSDLPSNAFCKKPLRALISIPFLILIIIANLMLIKLSLPWYFSLSLSVLLGNLYGSFFFFGHEVAHGVVFRSKHKQDLILFPAFLIFCLSPHFWRSWHNTVHHTHTNVEGYDPDNFGTLDLFKSSRYSRVIHRFAPGSQYLTSFIFIFIFFTLHAQGVLWRSTKRIYFPNFHKRRAVIETFLMIIFWVAFGFSIGLVNTLFVILIPMLTANGVIMSYIVTNHLMRPLTNVQDTLTTSMSVTTLRTLDKLHFHFSHHVEHHLFPQLSTKYAPIIRKSLQRHAGDRYLSPSHLKSLLILYQTPRIYDGQTELVNPPNGHSLKIKIIEERLKAENGKFFLF